MVSEIIWTKEALSNLEEISNYISRDSLFYAERTIKSIFKSVKKLESQPEIGMPLPVKVKHNIRRILFKSFRIIYCIHNSKIYIISVFWQSRPLETDFDFIEDYLI